MKLKILVLNIARCLVGAFAILAVIAYFMHYQGDFWGYYFARQNLTETLLAAALMELVYKYAKLQELLKSGV